MLSNFSSKHTNKSKLSFLQQKDNKKLKTNAANPIATTSESSTSKGKQKADSNSIEVDGTTLSTFNTTTIEVTSTNTTSQDLNDSIYSSNKIS